MSAGHYRSLVLHADPLEADRSGRLGCTPLPHIEPRIQTATLRCERAQSWVVPGTTVVTADEVGAVTRSGNWLQESQMGPNAGMPRRSNSVTTRSVTALLETMMTASAPDATYAW